MSALAVGRWSCIAGGAVWFVNYLLTQSTGAMFLTVGLLAVAGLCTILEEI